MEHAWFDSFDPTLYEDDGTHWFSGLPRGLADFTVPQGPYGSQWGRLAAYGLAAYGLAASVFGALGVLAAHPPSANGPQTPDSGRGLTAVTMAPGKVPLPGLDQDEKVQYSFVPIEPLKGKHAGVIDRRPEKIASPRSLLTKARHRRLSRHRHRHRGSQAGKVRGGNPAL